MSTKRRRRKGNAIAIKYHICYHCRIVFKCSRYSKPALIRPLEYGTRCKCAAFYPRRGKSKMYCDMICYERDQGPMKALNKNLISTKSAPE